MGTNGNEAAEIIKRENDKVRPVVIHENAIVLTVYICDRVFVRVNDNGIVTEVPQIG